MIGVTNKLKITTVKDILKLGYEILHKENNATITFEIVLDDINLPLIDLESTDYSMKKKNVIYDKTKLRYQLVNYRTNKIVLDNVPMSEIIDYFNKDAIAFHPSVYITDYMNSKSITIKDFAKLTGIPLSILSSVIQEDTSVNSILAKDLENATGISAQTWVNLQKTYDKVKTYE